MSTNFEHFDAGLSVIEKQLQTALSEAVTEWDQRKLDQLGEARHVLKCLRRSLRDAFSEPVPSHQQGGAVDMVAQKDMAGRAQGLVMMGGRYA